MRSTEVLPRQKVAIFESMSRAVEAGQYDKYLLYRHGVEAISLPGGSYPMPEVVSDFVHAAKLPKDSLAAPARALLEADSTNREARWQVLRSALLNNRVDEADSISAAGRRLHPEDLTFYYFGGLARLTMGHSAEAIALFHAAFAPRHARKRQHPRVYRLHCDRRCPTGARTSPRSLRRLRHRVDL